MCYGRRDVAMIDAIRIQARAERAIVWGMYLDATRLLAGAEYGYAEPVEWERLSRRLAAIDVRLAATERMLGVARSAAADVVLVA